MYNTGRTDSLAQEPASPDECAEHIRPIELIGARVLRVEEQCQRENDREHALQHKGLQVTHPPVARAPIGAELLIAKVFACVTELAHH